MYESNYENQWDGFEHGRHHLITGQWCKLLTVARETTDDVNGSQGIIVQFIWCEWISWHWTPHKIFWSKAIDVNLLSRARKIAIDVCKHQGTQGVFLSQLLGWCVDIDKKSPIAGGPWCIPHQRHETCIMIKTNWSEWCWYGTGSGKADMKWRLKSIVAEINWITSLEHISDTEWSWQHWPKTEMEALKTVW